ncbi:MAG: hypothetical protein ABI673_03355, partial [Novosphingobium sp.]
WVPASAGMTFAFNGTNFEFTTIEPDKVRLIALICKQLTPFSRARHSVSGNEKGAGFLQPLNLDCQMAELTCPNPDRK